MAQVITISVTLTFSLVKSISGQKVYSVERLLKKALSVNNGFIAMWMRCNFINKNNKINFFVVYL